MSRGGKQSLLIGGPIKSNRKLPASPPAPRIETIPENIEDLGLEDYIIFDRWVGGQYWMACGKLEEELRSGRELENHNDFRVLVSRASANQASKGFTGAISFSKETTEINGVPAREVEEGLPMKVNANYLEKALRITGRNDYRWHTIEIKHKRMAVAYLEEDAQILLAELR